MEHGASRLPLVTFSHPWTDEWGKPCHPQHEAFMPTADTVLYNQNGSESAAQGNTHPLKHAI